jgi:hypothetical protein
MTFIAFAPIQFPIPSQAIAGMIRMKFGIFAPLVPNDDRVWIENGIPVS